jgi:hypothetical protein
MVTQGGLEQQMPPQAMVITFGFPVESYDPTHQTGAGKMRVFAPNDFFMWFSPFSFIYYLRAATAKSVTDKGNP